MKWSKKYIYPSVKTNNSSGVRTYSVNGVNLPSVTTILKMTESEEKKESLLKWREKIGDIEADRIIRESSKRGSKMHKYLEEYLIGQTKLDIIDDDSFLMSKKIIDSSLDSKLSELWGAEVNIYYPDLFAGTIDACGLYDGKESIIDFKQSNKPKKREWIEDYFFQVAAYSLAHNEVHNTNITQGVILVCTPPTGDKSDSLEAKLQNIVFQEFKIDDNELFDYQVKFKKKAKLYMSMTSNEI
tara:strand:+ start:1142 stop:1867 length:726 start_codon:yes stop_codon:yes gene_type:complete